jgi:uncharacterized protein YndB with AHSA1/START domain
MIYYILIGIAVVVILLLIVAAVQPSQFSISRSATIAAPPATVFANVNDFHKWQAWSPWAKMDPNARNTFSGPDAGVGAAFAWSGNNKVGAGQMTITESRPAELIHINLEFERPMKAINLTEFTFKPDGSQTVVTWTMSGKNGFMAKLFVLFMNCDKMIGGQFEKGLAQLRSVSESALVAK